MPLGQGRDQAEAGSAHHPEAARAVGEPLARDGAEQPGEQDVAHLADPRHPALGVEAARQDDVGPGPRQATDQRDRVVRVAGAVGVDEAEEVGVGRPPARLDRRAIALILGEPDLDRPRRTPADRRSPGCGPSSRR